MDEVVLMRILDSKQLKNFSANKVLFGPSAERRHYGLVNSVFFLQQHHEIKGLNLSVESHF